MKMVIFDLETTGFSPCHDEIIQIAAVRMYHGEVIAEDRFEAFVRPEHRIPAEITGITGITDEDVRDAPTLVPTLQAFSRFAGNDILVAHSGWRFDLNFIRESCQRHQLPMREVPCLDSVQLSRRAWAGERKHNLDAVLVRLGISMNGRRRHDARGDVDLLAEAVQGMWRQLGVTSDQCPVPLRTAQIPA